MEIYIGCDLGARRSALCVMDPEMRVLEEWQGHNLEIIEVLKRYRGKKVFSVVESCGMSEWYCRQCESEGIEVSVIDSRHTKDILRGKKKTDKIDAKLLAELSINGWYNKIYRKSSKDQELRSYLKSRRQIVQAGTKLQNTIRGLFKIYGMVIGRGKDGDSFYEEVLRLLDIGKEVISELERGCIMELLGCWQKLSVTEKRMYKELGRQAKKNTVAVRLMSVPGVGPVTALCYASTISDPSRFSSKEEVSSYVGLAPRVYQSGDRSYHGRVTKQGDSLLRSCLVESAHVLLSRCKKDFSLKRWGENLAERKGYSKAKIAVARKLSVLLFKLWESGKEFECRESVIELSNTQGIGG
jgi:transposase